MLNVSVDYCHGVIVPIIIIIPIIIVIVTILIIIIIYE